MMASLRATYLVAIVRLSHLSPTRCRALLRLAFGLADLDRGPEILPPETPDVRNLALAACNLQTRQPR